MNVSVDVHEDVDLIRAVRDLALEGYEGLGKPQYEPREKYEWLRELGSRLWLDTGDASAADTAWAPELEALTTNNTLVNQVVQTGVMDGQIAYATRKIRDARPDISIKDLVIELAFLVNAKLALSLVQKFGAYVSVELHPDVAHNVTRTMAFARRYYDINSDFFYIKVPLTPDGFIATRLLSAEKIPVNFTLGFSARQNYLASRFSNPRFVNVFLGRLNQLVEENHLGNPENVGEKTALASYEVVAELRRSHRNIVTEQIAASLRSGKQILKLAGIDVLTIPPKAALEYLALDIAKQDVRIHSSMGLKVDLDMSRPVLVGEIMRLWEVDEQFIAFVGDAVSQADTITSGKELVNLSIKHEVNLFHEWSSDDLSKIREHGKIPDLSQWVGLAVDELMTVAALESFAKDQVELDSRIERIIHEA